MCLRFTSCFIARLFSHKKCRSDGISGELPSHKWALRKQHLVIQEQHTCFTWSITAATTPLHKRPVHNQLILSREPSYYTSCRSKMLILSHPQFQIQSHSLTPKNKKMILPCMTLTPLHVLLGNTHIIVAKN